MSGFQMFPDFEWSDFPLYSSKSCLANEEAIMRKNALVNAKGENKSKVCLTLIKDDALLKNILDLR